MILPFSTKLNNKPTYFPEKIIIGLNEHKLIDDNTTLELMLNRTIHKAGMNYDISFDRTMRHAPKLHTIRKDGEERWRKGMNIHFFINNRQPNMYQFAPVVKCTGTQEIFMTYINGRFEITIDDKYMYYPDRLDLALNDGFDSLEEFERYFIPQMENYAFSGRIIHWTNLRYEHDRKN